MSGEVPTYRVKRQARERAGGRCERCGADGPLAVHRKLPGCRGGRYEAGNVQVLCRPCHRIADKEAEVFGPEDEKFVAYTFRLSPQMLEELRRQVPAAGRAEFIRRALARELGWPQGGGGAE